MDHEIFEPPIIDFEYFIEACKKGILSDVKESLSRLALIESQTSLLPLKTLKQKIINSPDENNMSGYMYAVNNNRLDVVRYFLYDYDCESFYKNDEGNSALLIAAQKGFVDCLKYILRKDGTINDILLELSTLKRLYSNKNILYNKIDNLIHEFGESHPEVIKLFTILNKMDEKEKEIYTNLDLLDFEQIILCFRETSDPIIISLLNNTFGNENDLNYIYENMQSEGVL